MDKAYPTDLTDDQWAVVRPLLPPARRGGRPRTTDLRLVLNTIFYLNKAGCQWAMLPKSPGQAFDGLRLLHRLEERRRLAGDSGCPAAAGARGGGPRAGAPEGGDRFADGQGQRGGRPVRLRRRQEDQRPQAAFDRGFLGFAAGGAGHLRQPGRRHDGPASVRATDAGAAESSGRDSWRRQVQQPDAGSVLRRGRRPRTRSPWWNAPRASRAWCTCPTAGSSSGPTPGRGNTVATARTTNARRRSPRRWFRRR